jgi:hypothetical protein
MNLKLFLSFLMFGVVQSRGGLRLLEEEHSVCEEHNEKFDLFLSCLKMNNYDYNVCREFYKDMDWQEWTANECYFTLHLPRL